MTSVPERPPTKPHFFKPLLPGFLHDFLIPIAFFTQYLGGDPDRQDQCKIGVLRSSSGKPFQVAINGRRLEAGWPEFATEHELHVGDFVVFGHEGGLVFDVRVYDLSACQRVYPRSEDKGEEAGHQFQAIKVEDDSDAEPMGSGAFSVPQQIMKKHECIIRPKVAASAFPSHANHPSFLVKNGEKPVADIYVFERGRNEQEDSIRQQAVATSFSSQPKHPSFEHVFTPSDIKWSILYPPRKFVKENGLYKKSREMILRDDMERTWPVQLICKQQRYQSLCNGWRVRIAGLHELIIANLLKIGDSARFELVEKGAKLAVNIHVSKRL